MNKNIHRVFLITTLLVLFVGLGAISAADVNDNNTVTTVQDTPSTSIQVADTVTDNTNNKVDTVNVKDSVVEDTQKNIEADKEVKSNSNTLTKNVKSASSSYITEDNYNQYFDNGIYNSSSTNIELRSDLYNKNITFNTKIENFNNPNNFTLYNSTITFKSTANSITYINDINIVNTDNRTTSIVCDGQYRFLDFKKIHVYQKNNSTLTAVKQVGNYPVYFENSTFDVTSDNAVVFDVNNSQSYILYNNITVSTNTTPIIINNSGIYIAANVINVKESVNKPIIQLNNIHGKNNNILANYLISSFAAGTDTIESVNCDNITIASNLPTAENNITLVSLEITNDIISLDEENIIRVDVTNLVGDKVNEGTVSYKIDGENITTTKVENGVSTIRYTPTKIRYYTVDIVYNNKTGNYTHATTSLVRDSNGTYSLAFHPINSTVKSVLSLYIKKTPTVTVDPVNAFVGGRVNITAHVTCNNTLVNDGRLVFKVNNKTLRDNNNNEVIYVNVENGLAVLTNFIIPSNWVSGNKTISAVYGETDMLTGTRSKAILMNLTKPSVSLELQPVTVTSGSTAQLTVKVTDNGSNVNDGRVVFKLNDKSIRDSNGNPIYVPVVRGVATLNFTVPSYYSTKDYKLSCVYSGKLYNRIEITNTLTVTSHNIKSRSISGDSNTNNTLVIDENNYNRYIKSNQNGTNTVTRQNISSYTEVILKNIPVTVNDYDIPVNHTLTLINTSVSGVGFHNNTTLRGGILKSTVHIGNDISNVTLDNITFNYKVNQSNIDYGAGWLFYIQADYFTLRNSRLNITTISNTINWAYDGEPKSIPIYIGGRSMDPVGNHALIENNNITVYIYDYVRYDGSDPRVSTDWPTSYGIYVTGTDATIKKNNIKITNKEGIPGWLYAIDTTRSNNTIIGNNMTVQSVNYTAGIYMDGWYGAENNYVANNIIYLQAGNASYHEDNNLAENVGYGITLTNGEFTGGSFSGGNYKNVTVINNTIYATGYAIYGIEGFGITNTTIAGNTLELNGTAVSGISIIGVRSNITGNDITVNGKDNKTYQTGDYLTEQTTGIALQRGSNNNITNNIITCDNNAGIIINSDSNNYIAYNIVSSANNPYTIYIDDNCNNISVINNTLQTNITEGDVSVRGSTSTLISNQVERLIAQIKLETPDFIKLIGDNVTINGRLVDINNNPIKRSSITLTIGDEEPVTLKIEGDGSFKYTYTTKEEKDNIIIKATYDGGAFYIPVTNTVFIDVEKLDSYIDVNQIDITTPKRTININGQLKEQYTNKNLANQTITIISNNNTYLTTTDTNGIFTLNLTAPDTTGITSIKANYDGNDKYGMTSTTSMYEIEKLDTIIIIDKINETKYNNIINITGTLIDTINTRINNTTLIITLNNKNYETTTKNGEFNLTLKADTIGINNITVTYNGSTIYDSSKNTISFNVTRIQSIITTTNMTGYLGSNVILNATIKDINGNPITNGSILIKINNKSHGYANITRDGKIAYTLQLDPNKYGKEGYNITFVYSGSDTTETARTETRLNVIPFNPIIKLITTPSDLGDNVTMTVTITNGQGYNALSGNIGFKINGLTYKINKQAVKVQVKNGTVTLSFYASKKFIGNNNITILYSGNGKFNQIKQEFTNTVHINNYRKTIIQVTNITAKIGQNITINAKITDKNGNPLTKGTVAIKINGKTFGHANITNGKINYTQYIDPNKFSAKNYTITIKFGGKGQYAPAQVNTTLTLSKYTPTFTYTPTTVKKGTNAKITVKIADGQVNANNGTVGLKINGKTYKINKKPVTVKPVNGTATFTIPTNNLQTNNNITFTYSGNRQFTGAKYDIANGLIIRT